MSPRILIPVIGLLAVVGGVCGIWYSGLNQPGLSEELPPLPNQDEVVPELFQLVNQARNEVIRDPRNAGLWLTLALIYDSNMDFGKARQCYEQSITLDPDCMTCWYHTAHIRFITSDYDGCIEAIKRVIQLQDNFAMAHWRLGYWLVYRGNINDAEASFIRATRIDARDPAGWFGLAIVRMEQGRNEEAVKILEDVLNWSQLNRPYGYQLLGTVYHRLGRTKDAEQTLLLADGGEVEWPDSIRQILGQYHRGAGWTIDMPLRLIGQRQYDQAIQLIHQFLSSDPENYQLLSNLAIAHRMKGQLDESIDVLQKAVAINASVHTVHFNLGLAYLMKAREADANSQPTEEYDRLALHHAELSLKVNPAYASGRGLRGQLFERQDRFDEASEEYRIAAKDRESGRYWMQLQISLLKRLNRWDQATGVLGIMSFRFPPQPETLNELISAQIKAARFTEAEETINRYASLWPKDGRLAWLKKDLDAARQAGSNDTR